MKILFWNCRGLGQPQTVQELTRLIREHKPSLVFLSETRQNKAIVEGICRRNSFSNCLPVCVEGKGGGLALFVSSNLKVDLISFGPHHIDVSVLDQFGKKWRNSFVYGEPRPSDRPEFWKLIRRIKPCSADPWLMCGDFNEALFQFEHLSARKRSESQMEAFRDTLDHCNLHDLGFSGTPWTYNNKQRGNKNVRVRLDRDVSCPAWTSLFPQASVRHLTSSRSDHCPLLLDLGNEGKKKTRTKKRSLRYEAMWERESSLGQQIEEAWTNQLPASDLSDIHKKLSATMACLGSWSSQVFGSVNKEIKLLKTRLEDLQKSDFIGNQEYIKTISSRLDEILLREEIMWKQRSRINWLREGDQNTRYFHRKASGRSKKNKISRLKRADGSFAIDEEEILSKTHLFFNELYTEDPQVNPGALLQLVEPSVSDQINQQLTADFTDEEIGDALFQIGPLKAPGPDGLPARFFQRNWALLREETCKAIKKFFSDGILPEEINMTKIVLIPKSEDASDLKDYRPISLCNVVYKIISKCLVNRLRPYLQNLIGETQSAFIPCRLISDNAMIAFECFHAIQRNKKPDECFCAYKLDLSKAYDRVDWSFLEGLLMKSGFNDKWVSDHGLRYNSQILCPGQWQPN